MSPTPVSNTPRRKTRRISYLQAISEAQSEEMTRDPDVIIMGEDIEANVFGTSGGFVDRFGSNRVRNTPISEAGFTGAAIGAAMTGLRPIVDYTVASFLYIAMDQLVNQAAKLRYMSGGQTSIPAVFRAAMFYDGAFAAHHSDRPYPMFMNTPGLKVILPSGPYDVKGLLKSAIRDNDPVLCFEPVGLWNSREIVPPEEYLIPLGVAEVKREGTDVTVVALGATVPEALRAATSLAEDGVSVEVVDPRTLVPMDWPTIFESVRKTGRLIVVDAAARTCSAGSEISATVSEELFDSLSARPVRLTGPDIQIPFSPPLERGLYPRAADIHEAAMTLIKGS